MSGADASPILVVTGVLTAGAAVGVIAPGRLLGLLLGIEGARGSIALLGRYAFLLVSMVGGLLVYSAYHPEVRGPAMTVGAIEKAAFGAFVVASPLRKRAITMVAVGADLVMVALYGLIAFGSGS
jgi:hypothetical protein